MKGGRSTCDSKIDNATRRNVAHSGYLLHEATMTQPQMEALRSTMRRQIQTSKKDATCRARAAWTSTETMASQMAVCTCVTRAWMAQPAATAMAAAAGVPKQTQTAQISMAAAETATAMAS